MPVITLAVAETRLQAYVDAELAVLGNQSYKIGDRELTRADLKEIREGIDYWEAKVDRLQPTPTSRGRMMRAVPGSS